MDEPVPSDSDPFGNLAEWGRLLDRLERLAQARELDSHQEGLLRLLRYRDNWRLREAALEAVCMLRQPSEGIVHEVLKIMTDESLYYEVRVLAAEALGALIQRVDDRPNALKQDVISQMRAILDSNQPPVMHQAIRRFLPAAE